MNRIIRTFLFAVALLMVRITYGQQTAKADNDEDRLISFSKRTHDYLAEKNVPQIY